MIRLIVENILLFLLPTVLYVLYVMIRRSSDRNNTVTRALDSAPLVPLFSIGFVLMVSVLAYFASQSGSGKPGQTYRPPQVVDGKIQPGRFE
ncbi:MAG: DUF6111 family protein [Hyphomicrobiaceae bacterium]